MPMHELAGTPQSPSFIKGKSFCFVCCLSLFKLAPTSLSKVWGVGDWRVA